jgi:hypothetical protein
MDRNMREPLLEGGELVIRYNSAFPRTMWEMKFIEGEIQEEGGYLLAIGRLRVFIPGGREAGWARHLDMSRRDRRAGDKAAPIAAVKITA